MSTNPASTANTRESRRPSLSGSATSRGSHKSFESSDNYQPDGASRMANLFDSVAGSGPAANPGDQTIRPSGQPGAAGPSNVLRTDRAQTAPVGVNISANRRPEDFAPPNEKIGELKVSFLL
ncbi:uncharacterized protein PGTG_03986 [Puccinia graminis f. sp. tritici CRL 75-36-700-3]|uniref:Uncharacterized protein n=1 Tax=Puccinia graminis f. sp. tritici (strain CRL 75-36-700-3 / race SCCL) TaxID=418459 RepID=E3K155_PUCGT|nr:uncharacterized protein PGTG_03986 [Puccinia graminis f. sp. tritici CRL 75-36-700-3]EFP78030.2 hypothetical protein PGTG_03986 [Puccinia graminis f. sp. tritici CRL 75-36-700-3]